ncbi:MAG: DUF4832 domain-containing protein [Lentisphaeraceae bacterium]|nr:DUF4832 domain-containing protein [Lentisphaeraceae bacterium]
MLKVVLFTFFLCINTSFSQDWTKLEHDPFGTYSHSPLKGFVPYSDVDLDKAYPHTMEWFYLSLKEIMNGPNSFTFDQSLEKKLEAAASRRKQSIFRIYLDYPKKPLGVPDFLIKSGVKMIPYENDDWDNKGGLSPDYKDERLVSAMEASIRAMGKKYDGDPRIAFITVGYLGHWGEWHTYPNEHLMASRKVQLRIIKAFSESFKTTKFLLRYPYTMDKDFLCGLHDDSFAKSTLPEKNEDWHFLREIRNHKLEGLWKTQPIGGELYPLFQKKMWNEKPLKQAQNFRDCVSATHCSWLINDALFHGKWTEAQKIKASNNSLGYSFRLHAFKLKNGLLKVKISNSGVAPFYYKWPVEVVNLETKEVITPDWDIRKILPGKEYVFEWKVSGQKVGIRIQNIMQGGYPVPFENIVKDGVVILKK